MSEQPNEPMNSDEMLVKILRELTEISKRIVRIEENHERCITSQAVAIAQLFTLAGQPPPAPGSPVN